VAAGDVIPLRSIPLHRVRAPEGADARVEEVMRSGYVSDGEVVRTFESRLAELIGNPRIVTCADYSAAIGIALQIAGVGPGDDVVACPEACLATNMPILNRFARPVWADVDPATGNVDPGSVGRSITPQPRAILYAHWGGDVAAVETLNAIGRERGVRVVEDASEAFGAEAGGRKIGNTGSDFVVFSFGPIRHLTTGDGSAIFFRDPADAERARSLKRHGIHQSTFRDAAGEIDPESDIVEPGVGAFMNNIDAAIGLAQLDSVGEVIARHRENGTYFDEALADVPGVRLLERRPDAVSGYWVYTLLADDRDGLMARLKEAGIGCSRLHLRNDVYSAFGTGRQPLAGVEEFSAHRLCIPSGWWVGAEERERIVGAVAAAAIAT
jgi:dTDP-4-amino-4,6-dideoxygalactose transaminase